MNNEFLTQLRLPSPKTLLREMAQSFKLEQLSRVPSVRVHYAAQSFTGIPVKFENIAGSEWIALFDVDPNQPSRENLSYINLELVVAVTVLWVRDRLDLVAAPGEWSIPEGGEVPAALAIGREFQKIADGKTASIEWNSANQDQLARHTVNQTVQALQTVLRKFAGDDLAREAMKGIESIKITYDKAATVVGSKSGSALEIRVGVNAPLKNMPAELESAMSKVL